MKDKEKLSSFCDDTCNLDIIIEKNKTMHVYDDLQQNKNITFVLLDGAVLRYELHVINRAHDKQREKNITVKLVGIQADAMVRCLCTLFGDSDFKLKTVQHHSVSCTKSNVLVKGAFLKTATFRCDSLVKIEKNLKNITAQQMNKNLLIGCHARVVSIPRLEVASDDVQCKHGATIVQLDEEHLFYLQSRGINLCDAKKLLIDSFLN
jgi:Fe-S cluster assembly protein SufD